MKKIMVTVLFVWFFQSYTMDKERTPLQSRSTSQPPVLEMRRYGSDERDAEEGLANQLQQHRNAQTYREWCCGCNPLVTCVIGANCVITSMVFALTAVNTWSNNARSSNVTPIPPKPHND